MAYTLNKCAKTLSKRTVLLQLIIKMWSHVFWNTVYTLIPHQYVDSRQDDENIGYVESVMRQRQRQRHCAHSNFMLINCSFRLLRGIERRGKELRGYALRGTALRWIARKRSARKRIARERGPPVD